MWNLGTIYSSIILFSLFALLGFILIPNWYYAGQLAEHEHAARDLTPQIKSIMEQQGSTGLDMWIHQPHDKAMLTDVLVLTGKSYASEGQIKEAQILYEHACQLRQQVTDKRLVQDCRPSLAAVYGREGRLGEAGALYAAVIVEEDVPDSLELWTDWSNAAIENNKSDEACHILTEGALTCDIKGLDHSDWEMCKEFLEHTVDFLHTAGQNGDVLIVQKKLNEFVEHEPTESSDD